MSKKHHRLTDRLKVLQQKPEPENEALKQQLKQSLDIVNQLMKTSDETHVIASIREIIRNRGKQ